MIHQQQQAGLLPPTFLTVVSADGLILNSSLPLPDVSIRMDSERTSDQKRQHLYPLELAFSSSPDVPEGSYTITITGRDCVKDKTPNTLEDNLCTDAAAVVVNVILDRTPPIMNLDEPSSATDILVDGQASDNLSPVSVQTASCDGTPQSTETADNPPSEDVLNQNFFSISLAFLGDL